MEGQGLSLQQTAEFASTIERHVPRTWQSKEYAKETYPTFQLYDVHNNNAEYVEIANYFNDSFHIQSIRRLQNIYIYGRYLLRNQQIANRNLGRSRETKGFVCIKENQVEILGQHNVDYRRLDLPAEAFNLYTDPVAAHRANRFPNYVMVVCRLVREGSYTVNDAEICPEYIVKYRKN